MIENNMFKKIFFFLIILVGIAHIGAAQNTELNNQNNSTNQMGNLFEDDTTSTGPKKNIRDIVRNKKDTASINIVTWKFSDFYHFEPVILDTNIWQKQTYDMLDRDLQAVSNLGNLGSPYKSNHFFADYHNNLNHPFLLANSVERYILTNQKLTYYNTTAPFSLLKHSTGMKQREENTLNLTHAQNITKYSGFGLQYNHIASTGEYPNQATKNQALGLYTYLKKPMYEAYLNYITNKLRAQESGGELKGFVTLDPKAYTLSILSGANSTVRHNSYNLTQKLNFHTRKTRKDTILENRTLRAQITHHAQFAHWRRIYSHSNPQNDFYRNVYIDTTATRDSTTFQSFNNTVTAAVKNIWPGMSADVQFRSDFIDQYFFKEYVSLNHFKTQDHSVAFAATYQAKRNRIVASFRNSIKGYYYGDMDAKFSAAHTFGKPDSSSTLMLNFNYKLTTPAPLYQQYYSNHVAWYNYFKQTQLQHLSLSWKSQLHHFEAGLHAASINNYVYFDTTSVPAQHRSPLLVAAANIAYDLKAGRWHWYTKLIAQYTTEPEIVNLPLLSGYSTIYYFRPLFDAGVPTMIGIETFYNTPFYRESYNPVTAVFYSENNATTGDYPFVNAYLNFNLKKAIVFFKVEQLADYLTDYSYFSATNFPETTTAFKFGVVWRFFD